MPDGDIYAKNVPRRWAKLSRLVFEGDDDALAIDQSEKVLATQLRERPWDGFDNAVRMIAEAQQADRGLRERRQVLEELKRFASNWPTNRYEALRRVANRELAGASTDRTVIFPGITKHDRELPIAAAVLAEWVIMSIGPAGLALRMERTSNLDASAFHVRATEMRTLLSEAPGVRQLATQVLTNSNRGGRPIRTPRTRVARPSQIDLVNHPIG